MKRILTAALILSLGGALFSPCQAQFLKKLGEGLLQSQTGGQLQGGALQPQGTPAGSTNLPAGQYMMTNMQTGQGFYLTVSNNGQMFASAPTAGAVAPNQLAPNQVAPNQAYPQGFLPQQGQLQQPQQQGGVGGFIKGTLNNMIMNQVSPTNQPVPVQQQY